MYTFVHLVFRPPSLAAEGIWVVVGETLAFLLIHEAAVLIVNHNVDEVLSSKEDCF